MQRLTGIGASPHAPYTASIDVYAAMAELSLPLMTHLAENPARTSPNGDACWKPYWRWCRDRASQ